MYGRRHSYTRNSQLKATPRRHNFQCISMRAYTDGMNRNRSRYDQISIIRQAAHYLCMGATHQSIHRYKERKNQKKGLVCVVRPSFFVFFGRRIPRVTSHFITYTIDARCRVILWSPSEQLSTRDISVSGSIDSLASRRAAEAVQVHIMAGWLADWIIQ